MYRSEQVHFRNLKVLNNRPVRNWTNTDGIDFDSSKDCSLINAVIHAGDDNVVVKGWTMNGFGQLKIFCLTGF